MNDLFWTEPPFAHEIPFGYKFKNTHLTFGFILRGQVSGLNFLFYPVDETYLNIPE
jgi:hypothetical protein